jgi:hypothetical protein
MKVKSLEDLLLCTDKPKLRRNAPNSLYKEANHMKGKVLQNARLLLAKINKEKSHYFSPAEEQMTTILS